MLSHPLFVHLICLSTKKESPLASKNIFTNHSKDLLLSIFLALYLYKPNTGQSKNKKLFQLPIGALIKYFQSLKFIVISLF